MKQLACDEYFPMSNNVPRKHKNIADKNCLYHNNQRSDEKGEIGLQLTVS